MVRGHQLGSLSVPDVFIWIGLFCCLTHICLCLSSGPADNTSDSRAKKHVSFSWQAAFRIVTNGSQQAKDEESHELIATSSEMNGTLSLHDLFPNGLSRRGIEFKPMNQEHAANETLTRIRRGAYNDQELDESVREAQARHGQENENENEMQDEFELSPEMKVKIYTGVILGTVFLVVFVMCIWPLFKCCRTCCRVGTTGLLACWDLLHCRDPGYRLMCLAAKQAGLDPPTPEEYDRFMSGWEDQAPELLEALMP